MKITIKDNGIKVSVEADSETYKAHKINSMAINAFMAAIGESEEDDMSVSDDIGDVPETNVGNIMEFKPETHTEDRPIIRKRIPNNIVDPTTLTYKKAMVENALVRCPDCGQAHVLIAKTPDLYFMRKNFMTNSFEIVEKLPDDYVENVTMHEGTKYIDYFNDVQSLKISPEYRDKDIAVNNNTEIFCPICQNTNSFMEWKHAYDEPLNYFETDDICYVCGGEIEIVIDKDAKDGSKTVRCTKCGTMFDDNRHIIS